MFKAHSGVRRAAQLRQEWFRNEVLMSAGWKAETVEPSAYHKAEDLNDDDHANTYRHSDSFTVELRMDIKVSTIIGTEAKIVKQVSSWKPAGITLVRVGLR